MKKGNIYCERLIKLAKHLQKIQNHPKLGEYGYATLAMIEYEKHMERAVCYHAWIFDDLPILFSENWYFSAQEKQPFLKGIPKEDGSIAGVFDFFNLSPHEFLHLFDIDGQQEPYYYGGTFILNGEFDGELMYKQIMQFIKYKEALTHLDPSQN